MENDTKIPFAWLQYSLNPNDVVLFGQNSAVEHNFPHRCNHEVVNLKLQNTQIFGYYLGLQNNAFSFSEVAGRFIKRDWNFISGLSAQYILFILETDTKKLTVISDNTGSFPIYWATVNNTIHFSPNIEYFTQLLPELTINTHTLLNTVCHFHSFEEETLFTEVSKIPPGCFFTVENTDIIGIDSYLKELIYSNSKQTVQKFPDFETFKEAFFSTLELVVSDYLQAIGKKIYICDLSAGFDSSLISYMVNKLQPDTTQCLYADLPDPFTTQDKLCIQQFAKKHAIKVETLIEENENLDETTFKVTKYPFAYNDYAFNRRLQHITKKYATSINFTGHGGDELFGMPPIKERFLVKPYSTHAQRVKKTLTTTQDLFSQKAVDTITNSKKHTESMYYPTIVADSVINNKQKRFPEYWQNDICMLAPLTDPRIIAVCQKAPTKQNGEPLFQKEFWATVGPLIHVPRHFSKNKVDSFGSQLTELIRLNKEKITTHLQNSILKNTQYFKFDVILEQVAHAEKTKPKSEMTYLYWVFIMRVSAYLEYLSKNKKVNI